MDRSGLGVGLIVGRVVLVGVVVGLSFVGLGDDVSEDVGSSS